MTERLYYTDAYLSEFSAAVTALADGGRRVYLDRTAFYPTSGGQPHDLGSINGIPVVDVVDEDDRVAHLLATPVDPGVPVAGLVDWARRFDHMQQHTGQHLLSAVFEDLLGAPTASVHFGDTSSTVELELERASEGELADVEDRANAIVFEDREVDVTFEDAETVRGLRKPSGRSGILRIVSIDRLDRSACGGTHVKRTGEIGPIQLRKVERLRQRLRVEFLCGGRAVRRARADFGALSAIAATLSAGIDDAAALVESGQEELVQLRAREARLVAELSGHRAREAWNAATPDAGGVRVIVEKASAGGVDTLRPLALAVAALERALFIGTSDDPPAIMVAASKDAGINAGALLKPALASVGGRGGGSPALAQGSVPSPDQLAQVVNALRPGTQSPRGDDRSRV